MVTRRILEESEYKGFTFFAYLVTFKCPSNKDDQTRKFYVIIDESTDIGITGVSEMIESQYQHFRETVCSDAIKLIAPVSRE